MRLLWATDIHLDFTDVQGTDQFLANLSGEDFDATLVTGDISSGTHLKAHLSALATALLPKPVYFVLGNHDFYYSSFGAIQHLVENVCENADNLIELGHGEIIRLTPQSALIGHRGWADGRAGSGIQSGVAMSDFVLIGDLRYKTKVDLFAALESLGRESADYLRDILPAALENFLHVWIATHVPPFVEATSHEGRRSDAEFLPHFSNLSAGEVIHEVAKAYPDRKITVLCGHTHSSAEAFIAPNIEVHTGGAEYGSPLIQRIFEIG